MTYDIDAMERACREGERDLRRLLRMAQRRRRSLENVPPTYEYGVQVKAGADRIIACVGYALSHLPSDPEGRAVAIGDALNAVVTLHRLTNRSTDQ
jgi:hypothetical protein